MRAAAAAAALVAGCAAAGSTITRDPSPPLGECECTDEKTVVIGTDFTGNDLATKIEKGITVQDCCKACAADPECHWFQISTDPAAQDLCWLKSAKGGATNTQPRYGAAVAASYIADPTSCSVAARVGGWGWSFLAMCALASGAYAGLGVARTGTASLPHPQLWKEAQALVLDGVAFAKGGGARGAREGYSALPDAERQSSSGRRPKKMKSGGEGGTKKNHAERSTDTTEHAATGHKQKKGRSAKASKQPRKEPAAPASAVATVTAEAVTAEAVGPASTTSVASGGGGRWVHLPG